RERNGVAMMTNKYLHREARSGFTLIEMLVAAALTLFVMTILSQAFVTSLEVFSQLKGLGDMEDGLRTAATIIRSDLRQNHFEGGRKLSDKTFWSGPPGPYDVPYPPGLGVGPTTKKSAVQNGFLHIWQGSPSTLEGNDADGIPS